MPNKIQLRRGTAAQWTSANPILLDGELGYESDTGKFKVGNGTASWSNLNYSYYGLDASTASNTYLTQISASNTYIANSSFKSKGDLLVGVLSSSITFINLPVGSNNFILTADSSASGGMSWLSTISNRTLISPQERWQTSANSLTGGATATNFDILTSSATCFLYTSNATGQWTPNLRGNSTTSLNSLLPIGESLTVAVAVPQGTSAFYSASLQIDGALVTPRWLGAPPTSGNPSSTDIYVYSIIKTASSTYSIFASQSKYS